MQIETHISVAVPAWTAYEFFAWLDHLRLVSPAGRREWCPTPGQRVALGRSHEVCLEQGRHRARLRFRTRELRPAERIVDEFESWPLEGARRTLRFVSADHGAGPVTHIVELDEWQPPFFVRPLIDKRLEQQRSMFEERLEKAAAIIERAYAELGSEAFGQGVVEPARQVGFGPDGELRERPPARGH